MGTFRRKLQKCKSENRAVRAEDSHVGATAEQAMSERSEVVQVGASPTEGCAVCDVVGPWRVDQGDVPVGGIVGVPGVAQRLPSKGQHSGG